jgi:hypothetical protein
VTLAVRCVAALLLSLVVTASAAPASADAVATGSDARFAQTIAGAELTVVIRATPRVPAALRVEIIAYRPVPELDLALAVRSVESGAASRGVVRLRRDRPGVYPAGSLDVTRTGPHELELRAGGEVSTLPFRVLVPASSPWEFVIHGGLYAAGMLLAGGLLAGGMSRRPSAVAVTGGAVLGVAALTTALLSSWLPPPVPDGAAPPADPAQQTGRPYAVAAAGTTPDQPVAGRDFTLRLDLFDGSTGRPVDDLAAHHAALAHLVVTSADGGYFRHVHPLRAGPGRLEVRLRADRPGRYLAYAEIEREGSGRQIVPAAFTVTGTSTGTSNRTSTVADGAEAAGVPRVAVTPARPVAGRPATIALDAGGGVRTWLGMAGHLIIRDVPGTLLSHAHELGSMTAAGSMAARGVPAPEEGAVVRSSGLRFTFSFPRPGRYLGWVQYAGDFRIETVPFEVTVAEEDGT